MALTAYEVPIDWVPDPVLINGQVGLDYLGWQIGRNESLGTALWLIAAVRTSPTDLTTLLPVGYSSFELLDDVATYGQARAVLGKESISSVQDQFVNAVEVTSNDVTLGYR